MCVYAYKVEREKGTFRKRDRKKDVMFIIIMHLNREEMHSAFDIN